MYSGRRSIQGLPGVAPSGVSATALLIPIPSLPWSAFLLWPSLPPPPCSGNCLASATVPARLLMCSHSLHLAQPVRKSDANTGGKIEVDIVRELVARPQLVTRQELQLALQQRQLQGPLDRDPALRRCPHRQRWLQARRRPRRLLAALARHLGPCPNVVVAARSDLPRVPAGCSNRSREGVEGSRGHIRRAAANRNALLIRRGAQSGHGLSLASTGCRHPRRPASLRRVAIVRRDK